MLLVPAPAQLLEAREPVACAPRGTTRSRPGASTPVLPAPTPSSTVTTRVAVLSSSSRSWLMNRIVLSRLADPLLEPDLAGHVEEVVGLVEQQHLVGAARAGTPAPAASARRRESVRSVAVLRPVVGHARAPRDRADVPDDLEVVAAGVGVLRQRLGVAHLGLLVVGLHQRAARSGRPRPRPSRTRGGRHRQQQVGDGRVLAEPGADHLAHHAEPAGAGDRAGVRHQLAGDDPQQRRLAGAVGADQRDLGALADPERHVVEQHPAVGQLVAHSGDVHVTHVEGLCAIGALQRTGICRRAVRWSRPPTAGSGARRPRPPP